MNRPASRAGAQDTAPATGSGLITVNGPTTGKSYGGSRSDYAYLIIQFAIKDFKIRYTHSILGYAWSVLYPLIFFGIYYLVFTTFIRLEVPKYPAFLLVGIALWTFFAEGSSTGTASLLARAELLSKTVLPRQVVVYAALLTAGLTFAITLVVLLAVLGLTGIPLRLPAICFPLLLADLILLTLGISLLLAPLYVRFRDIGYLWTIVLQIGFWMTPVVYLDEMIPDDWRWIVWINPAARIIGDSRRTLVYGLWPGLQGIVLTTLMSIAVCTIGILAFRRLDKRVVEYL